MSTLKDIANFINKAAEVREASYVSTPDNPVCLGGYTKTISKAVDEVCADANDAYLVSTFLFTAWNDALSWAETELAKVDTP